VTETVIDGDTGLYFTEQTAGSLIDAIRRFERSRRCFDPRRIRRNAERFSIERFRHEFAALVEWEYAAFMNHGSHPLAEVSALWMENGTNAQTKANL